MSSSLVSQWISTTLMAKRDKVFIKIGMCYYTCYTCWELTLFCQRYQREVSYDISWVLKWCGTKTTQQPLNPVICSMPISANLYVGFRAHGYVRQQIRADAVLRLCWCWYTLPAAIWSGTNQGGTAVLNGRDLCATVTPAYRSTRPRRPIFRSSIFTGFCWARRIAVKWRPV